jgi:hypothetical protein
MSERLRAMSESELAATLSSLDLAWPSTPDLATVVMAATRVASRPRMVRLPLSRPKRILLIAAATLLLLAGVALAARFVIDLGAVVVEFTPGPLTQPTPTPGDPFGEALTIQEATAIFGDDLVLPERLGPPDRLWADEVFTDAGEVVRITAAWNPGPGLPVIEGSRFGAILMRFEGETDQAFKEVYEDTGTVSSAPFDGIDGIWTRGPHTLRLLTSEGLVYVGVDGNVLLWRDGPYTMRLETSLPKGEAVRIAASVGTP